MIRRLLLIALCLLPTGCEDDRGPVNRVVIPGEISFSPRAEEVGFDIFEHVYVDSKNPVAMFFVGDARSMSAQFVDADGLVNAGRLLSRRDSLGRKEDDAAVKASNAANAILGRNTLPDRSFAVAPAQGGSLLTYRYGKLSFASYAAMKGEELKVGAAIDMTLLAKLAKATDGKASFRSLPQVADRPGGRPERLLLFDNPMPGLGDILADNAAALFLQVSEAEGGWRLLDVARPGSLSDNAAIAAIQAHVRALPPPS